MRVSAVGMQQAVLCGARGLCRAVCRLPIGNKLFFSRSLSTGVQLPHQRATSGALPHAAAAGAAVGAPSGASGRSTKPAAGAPSFQEAISRLQQYWAGVGCALWLPHNTEVRRRAGGQQPASLLLHASPVGLLASPCPAAQPSAQHRGASGGRAGVQQLCCKQPAPNLRLIVPLPASASVPPASAPADAADAARRWAPAP